MGENPHFHINNIDAMWTLHISKLKNMDVMWINVDVMWILCGTLWRNVNVFWRNVDVMWNIVEECGCFVDVM